VEKDTIIMTCISEANMDQQVVLLPGQLRLRGASLSTNTIMMKEDILMCNNYLPTSQNLAHIEKVICDFIIARIKEKSDYLKKEVEKIM
jgi:hypothetical protein